MSSAYSSNTTTVAAPKPTAATFAAFKPTASSAMDVGEPTSSIGGENPAGGRFTLPPNLRSPDSGSWLATRNSG